MVGDRPLDDAIDHAGAFVDALAGTGGLVVDLGSGGGLPGLVVAVARPDLRLVLIERRATRADHLVRLVRRLGLTDRVSVQASDAQAVHLDQPADAVMARSFGPPVRTARAALRLLDADGILVVSEPPDATDRWRGLSEVTRLPWPDRRVAVLKPVPRETMRREVPRGTSTGA